MSKVITLTFGDAGENHVGNQQIGVKLGEGDGFNEVDLLAAKEYAEGKGFVCELVDLKVLLEDVKVEEEVDEAFVLVIRGFLNESRASELMEEMGSFEWDRKYWDVRRQKVLNKLARANVCFNDVSQEPNYEEGKGRIVAWSELRRLRKTRKRIRRYLGVKADNLICEGNMYDDKMKNGIGYHGDTERRKVIALRLEEEKDGVMPICYNWFYKGEAVGQKLVLQIGNGDLYVMSEKATGNDWKKRNKYTLRHAAGAKKYINQKGEVV